jgi:hypothetical protein
MFAVAGKNSFNVARRRKPLPLVEPLARLRRNAQRLHARPQSLNVGLRGRPIQFDGIGQIDLRDHRDIRSVEGREIFERLDFGRMPLLVWPNPVMIELSLPIRGKGTADGPFPLAL